MSVQIFNELIGKTAVDVSGAVQEEDMSFRMSDGSQYMFHHEQGCCEHVAIDDVCGDLSDLIGSPLIEAEEVTGENCGFREEDTKHFDSYTYTFYKFATAKGSVVVRWLGESNGYYSESVSFKRMR